MTVVSHDLAIWEGDRPASETVAYEEYKQLYDRHIRSRERRPPTPRIAAYVRALLDRYPDIGTDAGEDSPWADGPLMGDASGHFIYFTMVYSQAEEASAWAAQVAQDHGLVCYDPQAEKLRPLSARSPCHWRAINSSRQRHATVTRGLLSGQLRPRYTADHGNLQAGGQAQGVGKVRRDVVPATRR